MLEIANAVVDALDANQTLALATTIEARGAVGIEPGAKLLVREDGSALGSVGDERIDVAIIADCDSQIRQGIEARVVTYRVPGDAGDPAPQAEVDVYLEVIFGQPTILIAGAGHIAWFLSRLGKVLGYRVAVVDERPDFANRDRFPEADEVIAADMVKTLSTFPIGPTTYVVLVPPGHKYVESTLRAVIDSRAAYIGMIGSRAHVSGVFSRLAESDIPRDRLDRVYAPIGLRIGAQTPEEIALCILAEIVKVRRGGDAASGRDRIKVKENRDV